MYFKKTNKLIIFFSLSTLILPLVVFAALVPCGTTPSNPCTICHLYILVQGIINFLMWDIAPTLGVLVIAWGGFKILTAGGNPAGKQAGYKAITSAMIGLLIVFSAWIIINEFLLFFSSTSGGEATILTNPWTAVTCK
ncbi:MAG: hypothetical protein AAB614_00540 [Patescibacteria group bacterium]